MAPHSSHPTTWDGDGPLGEHHGARGFDHPPDYHSDDAFCEEDGICEGDGFQAVAFTVPVPYPVSCEGVLL